MKTKTYVTAILLIGNACFSQNPTFQWVNSFGSTALDQAYSSTTDASGNVYTTGEFSGTIDFDPGPGVFNLTSSGTLDIFITKFNQSGNFVWAKRMGGASDDSGNSIKLDANGNIYTSGFFSATCDFDPGASTANLNSNGVYDIFISKLDANGNFVWAKQIGGIDLDYAKVVTINNGGDLIVTGSFKGAVDFNPGSGTFNLNSFSGNYDVFVLKLDLNGNFIWAKQLGGSSADECAYLSIDSSDNIYTTGSFKSTSDFDPGAGVFNLTSSGNEDIFISKLDVNGNFVWAKKAGGAFPDHGYGIAIDALGNSLISGSFESTPADFDPGPGTFNLSASGLSSMFILKLDNLGNFVWAKLISSSNFVDGNAISVDGSSNVYATGGFGSTVDFDPGSGTFNLSSSGSKDVFVLKLDANGAFKWAQKMGGLSLDEGRHITLDGANNIYTTGDFISASIDFDPGASTYTISSVGNYDGFVHKLSQCASFPAVSATTSNSLICAGQSATLSASGGLTYIWSNGSGTSTTVVSPTATTNYTVTAFDANSCGSSTIVTQNVSTCTNINFNTLNESFFYVYPNPTSGSLSVNTYFVSNKTLIAKVVNSFGQTILTKPLTATNELNLEALNEGIYFLEVFDDNLIIGTKKIVIKK